MSSKKLYFLALIINHEERQLLTDAKKNPFKHEKMLKDFLLLQIQERISYGSHNNLF